LTLNKDSGGQALVVVILGSGKTSVYNEDIVREQETTEIAHSAGHHVRDTLAVRIQKPNSRFFIGKGKVEEIGSYLNNHPDITSVILSQEISPSQQKNLEEAWEKTVYTKNELIHVIFADRALTAEGKIKVELAGLHYQLSRLPGKGKEMSRTGAGIGTRGPGEQKIEASRRDIKDRIVRLTQKLLKINQRRSLNKSKRLSMNMPLVAIVGYTNAGKSTLLNTLTGSRVFVQDRMFATLHPTVRKRSVAPCGEVIFADTVGFIREMPETLKDAFRATLEEIKDADLIIELIDSTDPSYHLHYQVIDETLKEIGASGVSRIVVFNKCDHDCFEEPLLEPEFTTNYPVFHISARSGKNIDQLVEAIGQCISTRTKHQRFETDYEHLADLERKIFRHGYIKNVAPLENGRILVDCVMRNQESVR